MSGTTTDDYLKNNARYAVHFMGRCRFRPQSTRPSLRAWTRGSMSIASSGYAKVIRSLVISQRLLGTNEIILIHHTDCGMLTFTDDELRASIARETGFKPPYALDAFDDLATDVRAGIGRIKADPHLLHRDRVRGFIFNVGTGVLEEVR